MDCDGCKYFRKDTETCRISICLYKDSLKSSKRERKERKIFNVYWRESGKFIRRVHAYSELQARTWVSILLTGDYIYRNQMIAKEENNLNPNKH